jgi:PAS domain-containing protein
MKAGPDARRDAGAGECVRAPSSTTNPLDLARFKEGDPMNPTPCSGNTAFLHGMLSVLPSPGVIVDANGYVIEVNEPALALLGESVADVVGRRIGEILHCANLSAEYPRCGKTPMCGQCSLRDAIRTATEPWNPKPRHATVRRHRPGGHGHENVMLVVDAVAIFCGDCMHSQNGCGRVGGVTPSHDSTDSHGEHHTVPGTRWCITWGHEPPA